MSDKDLNPDDEFLTLIKKQYKYASEYWRESYQRAIDDLIFVYEDDAQWTVEEKRQREKEFRTTLQINVLQKYSKQVCGEMRKNKVKIDVHPANSDASIEVAKIRKGKIYEIEYASNAEQIYDHAGKMLVDCGFGAWCVSNGYQENGNPFQQEIRLAKTDNPFSILMDPDSVKPNFEDARYGFKFTTMHRDKFKELYPDAKEPGMATGGLVLPDPDGLDQQWYEDDMVMIVDYYYVEVEEVKTALLSDGRVMKYEAAEDEVEKWTRSIASMKNADTSAIVSIVKERMVPKKRIKFCQATSEEFLDKKDIPGKYIPIVFVTGEEVNIKGKRVVNGLIHNGKDSQRLLNYWHTAVSEVIALSPKTPWLLTPAMVENFERDYAESNRTSKPYLKYNIDPLNPGARPMRADVSQPPQAMFTEIARSEENIKSSIGMFNADFGDTGRELSGTAIQQRQAPGDTATYVFPDKMSQGVAYGGKIINSMIPEILDIDMDAKLKNEDGSDTFVPINTTVEKAAERVNKNPEMYAGIDKDKLNKSLQESPGASYNSIGEGEYDVVMSTGPSFETQRIEAADSMVKLAMSNATGDPLQSLVDKYYVVDSLDFPGSEEYANTLRKMIMVMNPDILEPRPGEEEKQKEPTPQEQMQMQQQQAAMKKQEMELEITALDRQVQIEKQKTEIERRKTEQLQQQNEMMKMYNEQVEAGNREEANKLLRAIGKDITTGARLGEEARMTMAKQQPLEVTEGIQLPGQGNFPSEYRG